MGGLGLGSALCWNQVEPAGIVIRVESTRRNGLGMNSESDILRVDQLHALDILEPPVLQCLQQVRLVSIGPRLRPVPIRAIRDRVR